MRALEGEMPAFFTDGAEAIAHCSVDPEVFSLPDVPDLRKKDRPDNYMDLELLDGAGPPPTRYEFVQLCAAKGLDPASVGFVPYTVIEDTERLAVCLAEHRKWPRNRFIRNKCLVYAGLLAHYAQDLCMPLHTTVHYNGRVAKPGDPSPRTGIHLKADALLQKLPVNLEERAAQIDPQIFPKLTPAVFEQLYASHGLVDRVYELESQLPGLDEPLPPKGELVDFTEDRLLTTAQFTASLYRTAWSMSQEIHLPDWHSRETTTAAEKPDAPTSAAHERVGAGQSDPDPE